MIHRKLFKKKNDAFKYQQYISIMEILFHVDLGCLEIRQHISVTKDGRKYSTFCGLVVFLLKKNNNYSNTTLQNRLN